jgi:hypothetical protein
LERTGSENPEVLASGTWIGDHGGIMTAFATGSGSTIWDVFLLFSVPIGGGMPAGVLLAKSRGMGWITMTLLYLISDIVQACYFEPLMMAFIYASKKVPFLARVREAFRQSTQKTISRYSVKPGPIALVGIAFGVDPMTGRAAALAAGHNFVTGWAFAISGDMLFFGVIAISTLCLNGILGDGTWTAIIIMAFMFGIPPLIRKWRARRALPGTPP